MICLQTTLHPKLRWQIGFDTANFDKAVQIDEGDSISTVSASLDSAIEHFRCAGSIRKAAHHFQVMQPNSRMSFNLRKLFST
jgi:hypothetical protein